MYMWRILLLSVVLLNKYASSFFSVKRNSLSITSPTRLNSKIDLKPSYDFDDLIQDHSSGINVQDLWIRYNENRLLINTSLLRSLQGNSSTSVSELISSKSREVSILSNNQSNDVDTNDLSSIYLLQATTIMDTFLQNKLNVESDTIHIMISSAFNRNKPEQAERLFTHYFTSSNVIPNSRSLNIMIENYRSNNDTASALRYLGLFKTYLLEPDSYTISSLFRLARTPQDVLSLLSQPGLKPSLTAPAIRCAVETLGRLGAPMDALSVALKSLPVEDSVFESRRSGDALVIALTLATTAKDDSYGFEPKTVSNYQFDVGLDTALKLCNLLVDEATNSTAPSIKLTGKGTTSLFTGIQREMRLLKKLGFSSQKMEQSMREELSDRLSIRARILREASLRLIKRIFLAENAQDLPYILNGRLCDAILRCFIDDAISAKAVWVTQLLPALKRLEVQKPGRLIEGAEKAFDAMMFVAGFNNCADIGVEIARTARKRNISREVLTKLAKSYSRGKIERRTFCLPGASIASGLGALVIDGMERTIEAELGCLLETNRNSQVPIKNIRFQFSKPNITKTSPSVQPQQQI